jgi:hypothetical protein
MPKSSMEENKIKTKMITCIITEMKYFKRQQSSQQVSQSLRKAKRVFQEYSFLNKLKSPSV